MCNQCPRRPIPEPGLYKGVAPRSGRPDPVPAPLEVKQEIWPTFSRQTMQLRSLSDAELPRTPEPEFGQPAFEYTMFGAPAVL